MIAFTESVVSASALYAAKLLGYSELKELQVQVIVAFVMGQNVFAILPTYVIMICEKGHQLQI